jgi:hypothetical protein
MCGYGLAQERYRRCEGVVYICGVEIRGTCYAYEGAYFRVLFVSYRSIPDVGYVFLSFDHRKQIVCPYAFKLLRHRTPHLSSQAPPPPP